MKAGFSADRVSTIDGRGQFGIYSVIRWRSWYGKKHESVLVVTASSRRRGRPPLAVGAWSISTSADPLVRFLIPPNQVRLR